MAARTGERPEAESARLRGNTAYSRGDWDAAISHYTKGLETQPHDARLYSNRSAAYLAKRKAVVAAGIDLRELISFAIADATAATANKPSWPDGWYRLYAAHLDAGALQSALRALQNGMKHCGENSHALKQAFEYHAATGQASYSSSSSSPLSSGYASHRSQSASLADCSTRSSSTSRSSRFLSSSVSGHSSSATTSTSFLGDTADGFAVGTLRRSSSAVAKNNALGHGCSLNHLSQFDVTQCAMPHLSCDNRSGFVTDSDMKYITSFTTSSSKALHAEKAGSRTTGFFPELVPNPFPSTASDTSKTTRAMKKATQSDALRLKANDMFRVGDWDCAIDGYTRSIHLATEAGVEPDRRAYSNRSAAWLRKAIDTDEPEAFQRALADAEHCIAIDASWAKAWFRKGSVLLEDGRPGQARQVFLEGLRHCPESPVLLESLAQANQVIAEEGEESDNEVQQSQHVEDQMPNRDQTAKKLVADCSQRLNSDKQKHQSHHSNSFGLDDSNFVEPVARTRVLSANIADKSANIADKSATHSHVQDSPHQLDDKNVDCVAVGNDSQHDDIRSDTGQLKAELPKSSADQESPDVLKDEDEENGDEEVKDNRIDGRDSTQRQTLYEVLNVAPGASDAIIRRAYYLAARELHPDKNPDDPNATGKFQRVSDAYQILSNPETRALYDRHGESGLEKGAIDAVDPQTLFAIVFGSDQFADYIGELRLTSLAANVDEDGKAPSQEVLDKIQQERVQKLVDGMVEILRPWLNADKAEFLRWVELEVTRLADTNFGSNLLATIGNVYVHRIDIVRGKSHMFGIPGILRDASYRTHKLSAQMKANAATNRVMSRQRRLHDRVMKLNREGSAISEVEAQGVAAEMARNAVDMMWKISVLDIQSTLEAVIERLLSGERISREDELNFQHCQEDTQGESRDDTCIEHGDHGGRSDVLRTGVTDAGIYQSRVRSKRARASHPRTNASEQLRSQIIAERADGLRIIGKMMVMKSRKRRPAVGEDG